MTEADAVRNFKWSSDLAHTAAVSVKNLKVETNFVLAAVSCLSGSKNYQ